MCLSPWTLIGHVLTETEGSTQDTKELKDELPMLAQMDKPGVPQTQALVRPASNVVERITGPINAQCTLISST